MLNPLGRIVMALLIVSTVGLIMGCGKKKEGKPAEEKAKISLKLGHVLDIQHPVHKSMEYWAERVQEKSKGRIKIDIYPSGQFGQEKDLVEQLQMATLDFTKVSSSALEPFIPEMKLFGIPYLFRDEYHKWIVLNGPVGKEILNTAEKKGMIGLGYYEAGERSFYTINTPIRTADDLKNLKIRVIKSPMAIELLKTLGASPTPISWGELYTALQQGTVDGAENNPPSIVSARHYEVCKFYSLDNHTSPMDVILASKNTWQKISSEDKEIIMDALNESIEYQRKLWKETVEENFKTLEEAGVEIIHPDIESFVNKVQPLYDKYSKDNLFGPILEKVKKAQ